MSENNLVEEQINRLSVCGYDVFFDQPYLDLSIPNFKVFAAVPSSDSSSSGKAVALVYVGSAPISISKLKHLITLNIFTLLNILSYEFLWCPGVERYTCLCIASFDQSWFSLPLSSLPIVTEDKLMLRIVQPLVRVLLELHTAGVVHGAVRLSHLLFNDAGDVILAPCLSYAHDEGLDNFIFEPLASAYLEPCSQYFSSFASDWYALAVVILSFIGGGARVLSSMTNSSDILRLKLELGSFQALLGRATASARLMDFLKGVLNDDATLLWHDKDISDWIEKRRGYSIVLGQKFEKLPQFIEFNHQVFWDMKNLIYALLEHQEIAKDFIVSSYFILWIEENFTFSESGPARLAIFPVFEKQIRQSKYYKDFAFLSFFLIYDSSLPFVWGGRKFSAVAFPLMPLFFPDLLCAFKEIIHFNFFYFLSTHNLMSVDLRTTEKKINGFWVTLKNYESSFRADGLLSIELISFFLLNLQELSFSSPLLPEHHISCVNDLVVLWDVLAHKNELPEIFWDNHILAYLKNHNRLDEQIVHPSYLKFIERSKQEGLYTQEQATHYAEFLFVFRSCCHALEHGALYPHWTKKIKSYCLSLLSFFSFKTFQESAQKKLEKLCAVGDCAGIFSLMFSDEVVNKSDMDFCEAQKKFIKSEYELDKVKRNFILFSSHTRRSSLQIAACIASFFALIIFLCVAFLGGHL